MCSLWKNRIWKPNTRLILVEVRQYVGLSLSIWHVTVSCHFYLAVIERGSRQREVAAEGRNLAEMRESERV